MQIKDKEDCSSYHHGLWVDYLAARTKNGKTNMKARFPSVCSLQQYIEDSGKRYSANDRKSVLEALVMTIPPPNKDDLFYSSLLGDSAD